MLDFDLAGLYGVDTKVLNQAVKRNLERFPADFMFQLTWDEVAFSRSQSVTLKKFSMKEETRGRNIKYLPYAFTEQGVAMLSSVLKSRRAVQVNIGIMRTFVRLRQIISANKELADRLDKLERKFEIHDIEIKNVFDAIRELMTPPEPLRKRIGFIQEKKIRYAAKAV